MRATLTSRSAVAVASLAIVVSFGLTVEYQPVFNALAR